MNPQSQGAPSSLSAGPDVQSTLLENHVRVKGIPRPPRTRRRQAIATPGRRIECAPATSSSQCGLAAVLEALTAWLKSRLARRVTAAAGYSAHKAQHISISAGQGENCQSIMCNIFYGIRAKDFKIFHY